MAQGMWTNDDSFDVEQSLSGLVPHAGSRCLTGSVREQNEDRCYADQRRGVFLVADGMGGHAGGEQASQAVIEVVSAQLNLDLSDSLSSSTALDRTIRSAILAANEELMELAGRQPELDGMGATVVVGVVHNNQLRLCHVGDSRAYVLREGGIQQLTMDDTLVQALVTAGVLTTGEAEHHPMRHVLMHSIGTRRLEKHLHVETVGLRPGDRLLFASDGVTDAVARDVLLKTLDSERDPQQAANKLADLAIRSGSRDNVTCIVVDLWED
jgi:serine/threonine protein phosphatase PrpC